MFIHLTSHSSHSLLEGVPTPRELAQTAQANRLSAIGLTDHNNLTGSIEFFQECKSAGIQPILGLDIDLGGRRSQLFSSNMEGWSNLCRLSSALSLRDTPSDDCPVEFLDSYSKGLIALINEGTKAELLAQVTNIFSGNSYLAFNDPAAGLPAYKLARKYGLPVVVTHPIYYLNPLQAGLQRTLSAIRSIQPINNLPPDACAPSGAWFTSLDEIETNFQHFPKALETTVEVAARCKFDLPLGIAHMPQIQLPIGQTPAQALRIKAEKGARELYGSITPNIQARLDHEIEIIAKMGFEPIFLIVEELLNFARKTGVPYSSRGSAASSLVAHCLGITSPDPLQLDLYFERFLNPARSTPPDIDTDLCSDKRDGIIQHVIDTYGADRVAMVATINRFRPRSALGEVAKAHGMKPDKVRELVSQLPYGFWGRFEENGNGEKTVSPFASLRTNFNSPYHIKIFDEAEGLLNHPRHLSVHPGGVIISPGVMTDLVPVTRSGRNGHIITQVDLDSIEALGLVKIDLLGIRGLTVLGNVAEFIQSRENKIYTTPLEVLDSTPPIDSLTSDRVENGGTIGCFQIESPGMRATLREIKARNQEDIMAALALYRPGPLGGGLKDTFVKRFTGQEQVQYLHPTLAPLLADTYGVILYQEQVLRIANELAGFSLAEADLLRRAMSHFDPGKRMKEMRYKFIEQSLGRNSVPQEISEQIWEMMAAFAGYGFPKAHAASYAQVAWRSAWCKTHFPAEFMAAVLANWGGYYNQRVYLGEARRLGLSVHSPHINHSKHEFSVDSETMSLYMGLNQIKDLTRHTINRIIRLRPFENFQDFLIRADPRPQEAVNLVSVGAFDGLGIIPAFLVQLGSGWRVGQMSLFAWENEETVDWTLEVKIAAQQKLLGTSVIAHPIELANLQITAAGAITTMDAVLKIGKRVTVAGLRQSSHRVRTSKGEPMLFLSIEDLSGMLDIVFFPKAYSKARHLLSSPSTKLLLITGVMEMDLERGEPFLNAENIEIL